MINDNNNGVLKSPLVTCVDTLFASGWIVLAFKVLIILRTSSSLTVSIVSLLSSDEKLILLTTWVDLFTVLLFLASACAVFVKQIGFEIDDLGKLQVGTAFFSNIV